MTGYWFVLVKYKSGGSGYSEKRYSTETQAKRRAKAILARPGVESAKVCYQSSLDEVDIKNFI